MWEAFAGPLGCVFRFCLGIHPVFFLLAHSLRDLSSPTRGPTQALGSESADS